MNGITLAVVLFAIVCFIIFLILYFIGEVIVSLWFFEVAFASVISAVIIYIVSTEKDDEKHVKK